MIISHNMASINTNRQLGINQDNASKSLEKLSSGFRINKAGDDAAGLAISEKMRGQIRGLDQSTRNAQDGISLIQTAEGSLSETQSILQRMKELATQSANDTNVKVDRGEIQKEMNQLTSEINRIGNTTEFNTQKLLKGKDVKVVATEQTINTETAGASNPAVATTTDLTVANQSVKAVGSTAVLQGNTATATGRLGITDQRVASEKASTASTVVSGITFTSTSVNDESVNGVTVNINQLAGANTGSSITVTGTGADQIINFNIGTNADSKSLFTGSNRGELTDFLKTLNAANPDVSGLNISLPMAPDANGGASAIKLTGLPTAGSVAVPSTIYTGDLSGGVEETVGVSVFAIEGAIKESGDTVTVAGKTFTAKATGADASKGEFNITAKHGYTTASAAASATTSLAAATGTISIKIDGAAALSAGDYIVSSATMQAYTGTTQDDLVTMIKGAVSSSGALLSSAADVSIGTDGKLQIISKAATAVSSASITVGTDVNVAAFIGSAVSTTSVGVTGALTGANADDQARSLRVAINADATVSGHYQASGTGTAGEISMTEKATKATGVALAKVTTAGAGANDTLNITDLTGKNLSKITIIKGAVTPGVNAATIEAVDGTLKATSGTTSTELNGVKISFSGLTVLAGGTAGASTLTTSWDATTQTLNVTGAVASAAAAADFKTSLQAAVRIGLTDAGFKGGASLTITAGAAATGATIVAADNNKTLTFAGGVKDVVADTMTIDQKDGNLTVYLADTTANKNTAAKIQAAVQNLGLVKASNGDVDFSKYQITAGGDWDTKAIGDNMIKDSANLVGGVKEEKGAYSFDITKAFAEGEKISIKGQIYTAVIGADSSKNQFEVSGGNVNSQASSLRDAINSNPAMTTAYSAAGTGTNITLTEVAATGNELKTSKLEVRGSETAGVYTIDTSKLLENGASFVIDDKTITASSKDANAGYAKGTAFKVADTGAQQTLALVDAINKNADLSAKYTASVNEEGNLELKQKEMQASATAPVVATKNSSLGEFTATLQIGANAGQSMTVNVNDMRATAIGVSGDGSVDTVAGKDGKVASYVTVANVTNGTDNTSVEFALDVSDHDKATNAISVIGDAIEAVSAERSKMGAFQNRLDHTISNLGTSSENMTAAESRIRDVDMAKEMMQFQKNNILQQAATAMMAQANQLPQGVLQLLR